MSNIIIARDAGMVIAQLSNPHDAQAAAATLQATFDERESVKIDVSVKGSLVTVEIKRKEFKGIDERIREDTWIGIEDLVTTVVASFPVLYTTLAQ